MKMGKLQESSFVRLYCGLMSKRAAVDLPQGLIALNCLELI